MDRWSFTIVLTIQFGRRQALNYEKTGSQLQITFLVGVDLRNLII